MAGQREPAGLAASAAIVVDPVFCLGRAEQAVDVPVRVKIDIGHRRSSALAATRTRRPSLASPCAHPAVLGSGAHALTWAAL